jgi:hypothetical protein
MVEDGAAVDLAASKISEVAGSAPGGGGGVVLEAAVDLGQKPQRPKTHACRFYRGD